MLTLLKTAPPKNSHQELVLQLYVLKREYNESEVTKIKILSQLLEGEDRAKLNDLWKEHIKARFPWLVYAQEKESKAVQEILAEEVAAGPVSVTPLLPQKESGKRLRKIPPPERNLDPDARKLRSVVPSVSQPSSGGRRRTRR